MDTLRDPLVARRGFQGQELFGEADGCDKIRSLSGDGWRIGVCYWCNGS